MATHTGCIHVLGTGHLAAAVRVQLRDLWRDRPPGWLSPGHTLSRDGDGACAAGSRTILLACADFECASSLADTNRRALAARSPLLFACLAERVVRVGPFVVPFETACLECHPTQRWDFSLTDMEWRFMSAPRSAPVDADTHLKSLAKFGASLIACELRALRFDTQLGRLAGCVVKFDPPCLEPERLAWPRAPGCRVCGPAAVPV
jgi:hypothetical protein